MSEALFLALIGVVGAIVGGIVGGLVERGTGPVRRVWVQVFFALGGLLVGLFVGGVVNYNQPSVPTTQPATQAAAPGDQSHATQVEPVNTTPTAGLTATSAPSPVAATPQNLSGQVPFEQPGSPGTLNAVFGWQPGASPASSYDLTTYPGQLMLVAGPQTNQWGNINTLPMLLLPVTGDFDTQVRVTINPKYEIQAAGFGVISAEDAITWIRLQRILYQGQHLVVCNLLKQGREIGGGMETYSSETAYFRIRRAGSIFTTSYSANGSNWVDLVNNEVIDMPKDLKVYLYAYSTADVGTIAYFQDFRIDQ